MEESEYLGSIGKKLLPDIEVMWTGIMTCRLHVLLLFLSTFLHAPICSPSVALSVSGPRVISRVISVTHAERVEAVLRRPALIWDNLHANDYDQQRVFLGPYSGRPVALRKRIAGVLTNPNCEFEANFPAMHTLAQWSRADGDALVEQGSYWPCLVGSWPREYSLNRAKQSLTIQSATDGL